MANARATKGTGKQPASSGRANTAEAPSDREIVIVRKINGPVKRVFEAFTDAAQLARWWGPNGFTTTTHTMDFRVGGSWEYTMHGPDGTDYPNHMEYREIVPLKRIVALHGDRAGDPEAFVSTMTFAERDGATEVTLHNEFRTRELRDKVVREYKAVEGGEQTLGRLAAFVEGSVLT